MPKSIIRVMRRFEIPISESIIDEPLTGSKINMSSIDLYSFYIALCEEIGAVIPIRRYDDFYSLNKIVKLIEELERVNR